MGIRVRGSTQPRLELILLGLTLFLLRPAYIAGVTNPIFESTGSWDLLCDVGGGRMIVSKDIHSSHPLSGLQGGLPALTTRTGTLKAEASIGSEDDLGRISGREREAPRGDYTAKADSADNVFIEDVSAQEVVMPNS